MRRLSEKLNAQAAPNSASLRTYQLKEGPLDYLQLPVNGLGPRQIRLIEVLQGADGTPIRCYMTVADLPTNDPVIDALPPNYIHCDHWVVDKPDEALGAQMHRDVRALQTLKTHDVFVPVMDLAKTVTQEDIITVISDQEINDGFKMNMGMLDDNDNIESNWDGPVAQVPLDTFPMFYRNNSEAANTSWHAKATNNYLAMSYAWGDPRAPKKHIFVNGHRHEVTESLHAGLSQFRKMEYFLNRGKVWIDALCINQSKDEANKKEKKAQLRLMGSIYRNAGNIIVWLGEADAYSEKAIKSLQSTSLLYRTEYIETFDNADPYLATAHREVAYFRMKASMIKWSKFLREHNVSDPVNDVAMYKFFDRPYWRRLWIIQELANGRAGMPIVCGSRVTQWRYIRDGAFMYLPLMDMLQESTRGSMASLGAGPMTKEHSIPHVAGIAQLEIAGHRKILPEVDVTFLPIKSNQAPTHGPLKGSSFKQALMLASRADVFDAKDRVYGMLKIPSLPKLDIDVDYDKSVGTVYREFAQAAIEKGRSLDILFLIDGCGLSLTDTIGNPIPAETIPSWVPDFGAKPNRRPGVIEGEWYASGNKQGFEWSQDGIVQPFYPAVHGDTLTCWGFVVERVDGVGAINPKDLEKGHIRPQPGFKTGVVQPTRGSVSQSYPDGDPEQARMDTKIASMTDPPDLLFSDRENNFIENDRDPIFYWVLCGGTTLSGAKAPPEFGCLTRSMPVSEPPASHPHHRNWHFLNANNSLLIRNRPLSSWFRPDPTRRPADATKVAGVMQSMQARTFMRRLIVTASGLLGLAPVITQPGDCIMILIGHGVPVLARPCGLGHEPGGREVVAWKLLGECFVDGMMEEEMMKRDIWSWRKELEPLHFI
ncbi:hypothetical protein J4E91_005724 [Alternaria rosae]|nr:hypothetical protein J4E91_005724 [Alternaria rosae]